MNRLVAHTNTEIHTLSIGSSSLRLVIKVKEMVKM